MGVDLLSSPLLKQPAPPNGLELVIKLVETPALWSVGFLIFCKDPRTGILFALLACMTLFVRIPFAGV
jgi:hypothetical protein